MANICDAKSVHTKNCGSGELYFNTCIFVRNLIFLQQIEVKEAQPVMLTSASLVNKNWVIKCVPLYILSQVSPIESINIP